jgi:hypothetical protein
MIPSDIFSTPTTNGVITLHTGGAKGSDTYFEKRAMESGFKVMAYSYKTGYHKGPNKIEISDDDFNEGILKVKGASKFLGRTSISKYINLLSRNWAQVKYSQQIFAVGSILSPGQVSGKGYPNKSKYEVVDGGTGWAVAMGIIEGREVHVFDQFRDEWFFWSQIHERFTPISPPKITAENFAGIGTRALNTLGECAISDLFLRSFSFTP